MGLTSGHLDSLGGHARGALGIVLAVTSLTRAVSAAPARPPDASSSKTQKAVSAATHSPLETNAEAEAEDSTSSHVEQSRSAFMQANQLYAAGQFGSAASEYEKAYLLSLEPMMLFNIAQMQRLSGDCEKAKQTYELYLISTETPTIPPSWAAELSQTCLGKTVPLRTSRALHARLPKRPPVQRELSPQTVSPLREGEAGSQEQVVGWTLLGAGALTSAVAASFGIMWYRSHRAVSKEYEHLASEGQTDSEVYWDKGAESLESEWKRDMWVTGGMAALSAALISTGFVFLLSKPANTPASQKERQDWTPRLELTLQPQSGGASSLLPGATLFGQF